MLFQRVLLMGGRVGPKKARVSSISSIQRRPLSARDHQLRATEFEFSRRALQISRVILESGSVGELGCPLKTAQKRT